MIRFLSVSLLSATLFAFAAPAAMACINDRESSTHEKEFKSDYLEQPTGPIAKRQTDLNVVLASGLGIGTLVLGMAIGTFLVVRRR